MKELDADEFRRLGHMAVELAADHIFGMRDRHVFASMSKAERQTIQQATLPDAGLAPTRILEFIRAHILPYPMGNGHPRFFGGAQSPPSSMGVLAELLAAAMNPTCDGGDHAATYVEQCAVRWLTELIGFPVAKSAGLLTSDGSLSTLQCLAAAKRATLVRIVDATTGSDAQREAAATLVMYTSEHVPDHLPAVAHLLGLAGERVRVIPMRDQRLDLEALRSVIASDRESGLRPFCVCASAGSQATGAIDPLRELAALCATESLWLHVDGSLGGLAVLDESLPELAALAQADSVVVEPQRWLGVPVECAVALVRDATWLDRSDAYAQLQRSSGFRALKLWSTLLHLGRDGVRSRVELHRALARALAVHVEHEPKLELMLKPELGIVCFRYVGIHEATEAKLNAFNRGLVAQLQAEGEVYPTGVELNGRYGLHVSVMHHATRATDLSFLVQIVLKAGARLQEATLR